MNPQVNAALISGGAALVVALIGIAGAIAAQFVATKRGFANSLALLERQHAQALALAEQERADRERAAQQERADRERERLEQLRREDADRFSQQRRSIYARFLLSARETREANFAVWNDDPPDGEDEQDRKERRFRVMSRAEECAERFGEVGAELEVIASNAVFAAAIQLMRTLPRGGFDRKGRNEYGPAREAFLLAVRRELGVAEFPP
jgi:hypothetical protein